MINDTELIYGAAFIKLINFGEKVTIAYASQIHSSVYLVQTNKSKSAILFKKSTKPQSAWSFTLTDRDLSALDNLHQEYPEFSIFLALLCHKDGICCLTEEQLWTIIERDANIQSQNISVSRKGSGSYRVNGPGRKKMAGSIPQNSWPRLVLLNREKSYEQNSY
ncbi:MAG: hypothetical protein F6K35_28140 [Okeania sp. SIO2H7]|nr:hypothetical protein [Okeania sp. SIO2H7]